MRLTKNSSSTIIIQTFFLSLQRLVGTGRGLATLLPSMPGVVPSHSNCGLPPTLSSSFLPLEGASVMASPSVPPPTPDSAATLQALDALLNEFFAPSTRNERKREIETLLNDFGAQKESWRMGFYFLANSTNEYVMMYSMTVIENVVNKRWQGNSLLEP